MSRIGRWTPAWVDSAQSDADPELHLTPDDYHVERLAHENDPVRAVVELIWNAIDAEAGVIAVTTQHDATLGGRQ